MRRRTLLVLSAALFGLAALYISAGWGELTTQHSLGSTGLNAARSEAAQVSNNGEGLSVDASAGAPNGVRTARLPLSSDVHARRSPEEGPRLRLIEAQHADVTEQVPSCWRKGGGAPQDFVVRTDHQVAWSGTSSLLISSLRNTGGARIRDAEIVGSCVAGSASRILCDGSHARRAVASKYLVSCRRRARPPNRIRPAHYELRRRPIDQKRAG